MELVSANTPQLIWAPGTEHAPGTYCVSDLALGWNLESVSRNMVNAFSSFPLPGRVSVFVPLCIPSPPKGLIFFYQAGNSTCPVIGWISSWLTNQRRLKTIFTEHRDMRCLTMPTSTANRCLGIGISILIHRCTKPIPNNYQERNQQQSHCIVLLFFLPVYRE